MSEELILYSNPMSRGRIARWMLEEVGQPYKVQYIDYGPSMKSPEFLAVNPMGKVPALSHGDTVITEGAAICAYLADRYPNANLAPPLDQRAAYYRWLFFAAGPVEASLTNKNLGVDTPEEKESMVGYGTIERVLDVFEQACKQSPYLAGDNFSAADVYAGSQIGFGLQFGSIEKRDAFEQYWARISDRDAYRRSMELDNASATSGGGG